jgi:type II secretory pathway pseudopilin PulG
LWNKARGTKHMVSRRIIYKTEGFTAVELMAFLVVVGVAVALAVPVFTKTMANSQLKQAADRMAWELRAQQQEAISSGSFRQIEFFYYGGYYQMLKPEKNNVFLPQGITYSYITIPKTGGNRYLLTFNITGGPNLGGTIALKNEFGNQVYVIITPVIGRIRVSDVPPE